MKYVIGTVYRPPHDMVSKLDQFINDFNLILQTFGELNYGRTFAVIITLTYCR